MIGGRLDRVTVTERSNEELFEELKNTTGEERDAVVSELVRNNVMLIHLVLKRRYGGDLHNICSAYRMTRDDVFSHGTLALWKSIKQFDPSKGFAFSTYAVRALHNNYTQFFESQKCSTEDLSMDKPIGNKEMGEVTLLDHISLEGYEDSHDMLYISYMWDKLSEECSPRDMLILKRHIEGITQANIGKEVGLTQSRVRKVIIAVQETAKKIRDREERYENKGIVSR